MSDKRSILKAVINFPQEYLQLNEIPSTNSSGLRVAFLRRSWIVVVFCSLLILTIESIEHISKQDSLIGTHFLTEVFIYGGIIPLIGYLLLRIIFRTLIERDQVVSDIDQHSELSHRLAGSTHLDDLYHNIAQIPSTILPAIRSNLYLSDPANNRFNLVASYEPDGEAAKSTPLDAGKLDHCQNCLSNQPASTAKAVVCDKTAYLQKPGSSKKLCLPLVHEGSLTAKLHIEVVNESILDSKQIRTLSLLAPEITLAIQKASMQKTAADQFEAAVRERKQVARDLHDTLGQNISILRLKLDQLNSADSLIGIADIRREISLMLAIADQAYDQVRHTLDELKPVEYRGIVSELEFLAEITGQRADLACTTNVEGEEIPLDANTQREIVLICREIFNNIEKHAKASSISVQILWSDSSLRVAIKDNGIGFEQKSLNVKNDGYTHYGLEIIKESTRQLKGRFDLTSDPGIGTLAAIEIPLAR